MITTKEKKLADRIPWTFDFGATRGFNPTLLFKYKKYMNIREPIYEYFDYDIVSVLDPDKGARMDLKAGGGKQVQGLDGLVGAVKLVSGGINIEDYFDPRELPKGGYLDSWGIYHYSWPTDPTFEVYYSPLKNVTKIEEIMNYPVPTIDGSSLNEAKKDVQRIKSKEKVSVCYSGSVYEWSWNLRGQEQFFLDLYDNQHIVSAIVERVSGFVLNLATLLQDIGVDILAFYDDFGTQDRLQIKPEHWRYFIKPAWRKIWMKIKERNKNTIIFLHSCGRIEEIIPDLIEIGLDVLHPVQPETMDIYEIAEKYQGLISIWGTISSQRTIPFGTPEEVAREVKERIEKMGKKGALIISPSNIMGPEVPLENINAFVEACRKYCQRGV